MDSTSPATIYYVLGSVSLVGVGFIKWLDSKDKAQEDRFTEKTTTNEVRIAEVKNVQRVLFEKHDQVADALQSYKLHVAETYVNREVLREQLAPINKTLEKIDNDLREMRRP